MNHPDPYLAVDHVRDVRRRYLGRMARHAASSCIDAARSTGFNPGLLAIVTVAVISASLWIVPQMA
ncbi:MAG: hypothetical protein M3Z31_04620 [Pseudomonadota bacterium]|nr:hypothetical protein [Pseudomonadota bacterium]